MKTMTGATIAALAFGLGLATTPVFAADYGPNRDRDRGQDATQQQDDGNKGDENRDRRRGNRDNHKTDATPPAPTPQGGVNDNDRRSNRQNMDYNNNNRGGDNDNDRWRSNRTNTDYNNDNNRRDRDRFDRNNNRDRFDRDRRDRNININIYRRNITSPRRYRYHTSYRFPSGYHYRRYHYGDRLPVVFWRERNYWLLDYIAFGLFAPPPGFVWVRYGDDALLIDTYTGEIIQVRYDVFYS